MERRFRILWLNVIIFSFLFIVLTIFSGVQEPSITLIRVTHYGFPLLWLKVITHTVDPVHTEYYVSIIQLILDCSIYLFISLLVTFLVFIFSGKSGKEKVER